MENKDIGSIQHIKETSDLFWAYQKKHGHYFMVEFGPTIKEAFGLLFSKMNTWELREAVRLPDNYFNSLMRAELAKRRAKAKLLRAARGQLNRREGQACLVQLRSVS